MLKIPILYLEGVLLSYQRRQWQPTPVLLPGSSHGRRSLVGCSPWGCEESETTERLHFHFSLSSIGEQMATHSSILAWRIPGTEEPGRLQSMGLHRVRHDWSDLAAAAAAKLPEVRPMTKGFATELVHMWIHVHRWFLSGPGNAMPEGTSILTTASYLVSVNLVSLNANTIATLPPTFLMCGMWKEQRVMSGKKVYWGPSWFSLWCWAPSCCLREEPRLKRFPQNWHS